MKTVVCRVFYQDHFFETTFMSYFLVEAGVSILQNNTHRTSTSYSDSLFYLKTRENRTNIGIYPYTSKENVLQRLA